MNEQYSHNISEFIYIQLADEIEGKIKDGSYRVGEKLPSLRNLSARSGLSLSTVYQAYIELEKKGVVEVKEKSGFFVKPPLGSVLPLPEFLKHPADPRRPSVNVLAESIYKAIGESKMLPLGAALPSHEILPVKQLTNSSRAVAGRYLKEGGIGYGPLTGVPELNRQIRNRAVGHIRDIGVEEIIITNGCMEAIDLSLRAVAGPGDTVVVESPSFGCYLQLIEDLNMLALEAPTDPEQGIDLESLFSIVDTHRVKACLLNSNFQNPLGFEMQKERKKRLVEFLCEKEIPLIEDDIYGDLYFGKSRPATFKSFDRKGLVLYCSSFSKSLAPELRVGWTVPGRFTDNVKRLKFNTSIATSKLNQLIIADFLKNGHHERHLRKFRNALQNQVTNTTLAIKRHFPPDTKVSAPKGGFILWVELGKNIDGVELFYKAKDENIFILPGVLSSATGKFKNCIRMGCGYPWNEKMEEGIKTLGALISQIS